MSPPVESNQSEPGVNMFATSPLMMADIVRALSSHSLRFTGMRLQAHAQHLQALAQCESLQDLFTQQMAFIGETARQFNGIMAQAMQPMEAEQPPASLPAGSPAPAERPAEEAPEEVPTMRPRQAAPRAGARAREASDSGRRGTPSARGRKARRGRGPYPRRCGKAAGIRRSARIHSRLCAARAQGGFDHLQGMAQRRAACRLSAVGCA